MDERLEKYMDDMEDALERNGFAGLFEDPDFMDKWRFHWDNVFRAHGEEVLKQDPAFSAGMVVGQHLAGETGRGGPNTQGMSRAQRRQLERDQRKGHV
jgi:hypothetical protein